MRQEHDLALRGRPGAARRGGDRDRRPPRVLGPRGGGPAAPPPPDRHGLPELRDLAAHDRRPERGLPAQEPAQEPRRDRRGRRVGAPARGARGQGEPAGPVPERRGAAARRAGPRAGGAPERAPAGRAPVEPGRQAPRGDAVRAARAAAAARSHDDLRHPRPGRGLRALGRARRDAPGSGRGAGRTGGGVPGPAQHVRRRVPGGGHEARRPRPARRGRGRAPGRHGGGRAAVPVPRAPRRRPRPCGCTSGPRTSGW